MNFNITVISMFEKPGLPGGPVYMAYAPSGTEL